MMFSGGRFGFILFGVSVVFALAANTATAEPAGRADDFVDRIGVNIKSPSYGNYALVYSNTALVSSKMAELGIRYYRVNAKDVDGDWAFCRSLYDTYGLKADMQVTFTFSSLSNRLRTNAIALVSVEGPNETDNPALNFKYNGVGFPTGTINLQNDLYHMVKDDPAIANLPVIVPSVAQPTNQARLVGSLGDYENIHSYPAGNIPRTFLDSLHIPNANLLFTPPKPIVSTETGYHTALQDRAPVSEKAQGKYMPRLFCDYWTRNIPRVYAYELFDEGVDQTDAEMTYGILRNNGAPKPAYTAEKNMIGLLNEPGTNFGPGDLDFSLSGSTNNVRHVLLQKSSGDFYLLLWQDVSTFNPGSKTDIVNADAAVTLSVTASVTDAVIFRYDDLGNLSTNTATISGSVIHLSVPDTVLFVRLSAGPLVAEPPSTPTGLTATRAGISGPIGLSWNAAAGAVSYNILRSTNSAGSFTTVASGIASGNYNDTTVTDGVSYYYVVTAVNSFGESADSNIATPDLIQDNADITGVIITGSWASSSGVAGFYGTNYIYTSPGTGASVKFSPNFAAAGVYDVYGRWAEFSNRATNTPFEIRYATGTNTLFENQQVNGGAWVLLGTFAFNAGAASAILVRNEGASGVVVADAVRFVQRISPATPQGLMVDSALGGQIALSWVPSVGAGSYNLKRSTNSGGPYITITNLMATNYSDAAISPGVTYFYVVSSVSNGSESDNSVEVSATFTAPPLSLTLTTSNSIALSFTGVIGGSYSLWVSTNLGFTNWTWLTTLTSSNSLYQFSEPIISTPGQRFYRLAVP